MDQRLLSERQLSGMDHTHTAASGTNYVMLFDSACLASFTSAPLVKEANQVITDKWRDVAYCTIGNEELILHSLSTSVAYKEATKEKIRRFTLSASIRVFQSGTYSHPDVSADSPDVLPLHSRNPSQERLQLRSFQAIVQKLPFQ